MNAELPNIKKILFVDDEPSVLSAMLRLFHDDAYEVMTASGGPAALELLREQGPVQLIISDYRMPGMNGVEFLQQVRMRWPDTRRVILSGYTDSKILLAALNEGRVHRFLVKPWDNENIKSVVKEMLDEYQVVINFRRDAEELVLHNRLLSRTNENLSSVLADVLANMRREVASGEILVDRVAAAKISAHRPHESLSPREQEIMIAVASGHSLKAVAMDLGISIKTVSTYKKRLFDKMEFKNDAELIGYILSNNLLPNNSL